MDRRWTAIAVAGAGAVLLAAGLVSGRWLVGSLLGGDLHVGLLGAELCAEGECERKALGFVGSEGMRTVGIILVVIGVLAMTALVASAALAATNRLVYWFINPETLAILLCGTALLAAVITLVTFQKAMSGVTLGTGPSFLLFGLGASVGFLGAILLGRLPRDDSMQFEPPFDRL